MEETKFECPHVQSGEKTSGFAVELGDGMKLLLCDACYKGFRQDTTKAIQGAVTDSIDKALREAMDN
jgi:hypothetical protein